MSSLTEEQKRRIEENRRKALELRAAKNRANAPTNSNNVEPGSSSAAIRSNINLNGNLNRNVNTSRQPGSIQPAAQSIAQANQFYQQRQKPVVSAVAPVFSRPPAPFAARSAVSGCCAMISRERFKVEMTFQAQAVAIFKSINGAQYDAGSKAWNFPFSEHQSLISAMAPLRPDVCLGGLPPFVLRIFRSDRPRKCPEEELSKIDPILVAALMPFQKDGVLFGISRKGKVLIADDMGLGKTIQALGIAHYYVNEWPLLIVAPSSMRYAWREAIWNWLPSVVAGSIFVMETGKDSASIASSRVVIMSYDLMQRNRDDLNNFKVIIMDESHHLKNMKAVRTKAALPLLQNAKRAILLSGTPALSRPIELFPQLISISSSLFALTEYGIRYCNGKKNNFGWDYSGSSNMQELSLILEETVMIRRMKTEVLQQLPQKFRKLVILDKSQIKMNTAVIRAAAAIQEGRMSAIERKGKLLELFTETGKIKLPAVCAYIKDLVESGKKIICFAHHHYMMDGICSFLDEQECKYIRIDGSSSSEDRQYCVDQFQSCEAIRVAVLSITAANSGITLTAANVVCFAELYWNPGILTQAEDRAHRIGQKDNVVVEYLMAKGTSDDTVWLQIKDKLDVLNKAGLSKDNFQDAEVGFCPPSKLTTNNKAGSSSTTNTSKQTHLEDFFGSSQGSQQTTNPSAAAEVLQTRTAEYPSTEDMFDDYIDESTLMKMMEDSFSQG